MKIQDYLSLRGFKKVCGQVNRQKISRIYLNKKTMWITSIEVMYKDEPREMGPDYIELGTWTIWDDGIATQRDIQYFVRKELKKKGLL